MTTDMTVLQFAILAFAAFRITRLVTRDVIFNPLREKIWNKYPPSGDGIGYIITCDWCTSIWVSSLIVAMYTIATSFTFGVCCMFAISSVVGLLTALVDQS